GSVNLEEKTGTMLKGMAIYSNAANPQAVLLPAPVDQETLEFEFRGGFSNDRLAVSARLGYTDFSNDDLVTWQNPYASGLGVADYPTGIGGYAPAPDYEMLSLSGSLGYRIGDTMHFTLDGMTSETEQQEALQGYTTRPDTVTTPLPADALFASLKVNMLATSLRAKPTSRLSLKLNYRFNERENTFARHAWQYVRGYGADQQGPEFAVFNRPLHIQKDTYTVEGKYRFPNRTSLSLIYDYEETQRDVAAVTDTEEDTVTVKVNLPRTAQFSQRFEMSASNLAGSTYEWSESFFQQQAVALINQVPDDQRWTNHPLLRQYHLANQEKISANWNASWFPNESWIVQGNLSTYSVTFDKSELGLTDVLTSNVNVNLHYTGSETYSSWVWADYTADERKQWGRDFRGGVQKPANRIYPPLPQGSDPTRNYEVEQDGNSFSLGFGTKWQVSDHWALDLSYAYLRADEEYDITTLGARDLAGTDFPDTRYVLHNLTTSLEYELQNGLLLSLEHQYFRYTDSSWQYDDFTIGDINKLLGTGQVNPNEAVNMLLLGMSYRF
ncbi:MAG: MtrB/PioB family outer membrane beta-barrel protein, partial [Pseudomonadales bacterium]